MNANYYNLPFSFDQIIYLIKQLPKNEKIRLSEELQKDIVGKKLTNLLRTFKTDELSMDVINEEVELVRKKLYEKRKKR